MTKRFFLSALVAAFLGFWCGCGGQPAADSAGADGDPPPMAADAGNQPPAKSDGTTESPPAVAGGTDAGQPQKVADGQGGDPSTPGGSPVAETAGPKFDTSFISADFVAAAVVHPRRAMESNLAKTVFASPEVVDSELLPPETSASAYVLMNMASIYQAEGLEQVIGLLAPAEGNPQGSPPVSMAAIWRYSNPQAVQPMASEIKQQGEQRTHGGKTYYFQSAHIQHIEQVEVPSEEAAERIADYKQTYEGAEITPTKSADGTTTTISVSYRDEILPGQPNAWYFPDDKSMIFAPEPLLKNMLDARDVQSPLLDRLSKLDAQHDVAVVALVDPLRAVLNAAAEPESGVPPLTRELLKYFDTIEGFTATASLDADPLLKIEIDAVDAASADQLDAQFQTLLQSGKQAYAGVAAEALKRERHAAPLLEIADKFIGGVAVKKDGARIVATAPGIDGLEQIPARLAPLRESTNRTIRLQDIVDAIQFRANLYGELPGNLSTAEGKPLLSWRVAVHSSIDKYGPLEFKQDEAWDSEHNMPLIAQMPENYASPAAGGKPGHTVYLSFQGKGTMLDGMRRALGDIEDGAADTIAFVEVSPEKGVPWSKPVDIDIDMDVPDLKTLLGPPPTSEGYPAVFFDGSVHVIPAGTDIQVFKRLVRFNDGQPSGFEH